MCERYINLLVASCMGLGGPGPQPRHVPLTGNQTGDLSVCRPMLNPLSHTSQGCSCYFKLHPSNEKDFVKVYVIHT